MIKLLLLLGACAMQDQSALRIDTSEELAKPCVDGVIASEEQQRTHYGRERKEGRPKASDVACRQSDPEKHWTDIRKEKMGGKRNAD
jgi:hypothetical protein